MEDGHQLYWEIREWANTMISRHGHMVIAYVNNEHKTVKQYKSAMTKLQKTLSKHVKNATDRKIKADLKELHLKVKILNQYIRRELV
jgi:hypothetical protein